MMGTQQVGSSVPTTQAMALRDSATPLQNRPAPVQTEALRGDDVRVQGAPTGNPSSTVSFQQPQAQEGPNWGLIVGIGAAAVLTSPLWLPLVGGIFSGIGAVASGVGGAATSAAAPMGGFVLNNIGHIASGVVGGFVGYGLSQALNPQQQTAQQNPGQPFFQQASPNTSGNGYNPY